MGGMIAAIEQGFVQREIQEAAYKSQRLVESGEQVIVGLNKYQMEEQTAEILKIDSKREKKQIERLTRFKANRNEKKIRPVIRRLEDVAGTSENLVPYVLEAVEAQATLGEITDALRSVFGVYQEKVVV